MRTEKATQAIRSSHGSGPDAPRLLARQRRTPTINDDIIALSEEFHIITPYTSLLVLDNDADRERFKVKRSSRCADGEKFFHEGLANADFELKQQQMKRAGNWRIGLRMAALRQFSTLGRNPALSSRPIHGAGTNAPDGVVVGADCSSARGSAPIPAAQISVMAISQSTDSA